jgi:hypothetical protein
VKDPVQNLPGLGEGADTLKESDKERFFASLKMADGEYLIAC